MPHNTPLKLKVSNDRDLLVPVFVLQLLVVVAALLSPHPVGLTILAVLIFGAVWVADILKKSKTNTGELISVIFPDGRVHLKSAQQDTIEGVLVGQQWCTRWLAILRISHDGANRKLVIRSANQPRPDDFRQLNTWLRLDLFDNTRARQVSGG